MRHIFNIFHKQITFKEDIRDYLVDSQDYISLFWANAVWSVNFRDCWKRDLETTEYFCGINYQSEVFYG